MEEEEEDGDTKGKGRELENATQRAEEGYWVEQETLQVKDECYNIQNLNTEVTD